MNNEAKLKCIFCAEPAGEDCMIDDANGAIACHACGTAEFAAQYTERWFENKRRRDAELKRG